MLVSHTSVSSGGVVCKIMVVAPMVMMAPSSTKACSFTPRRVFIKKVPVFDGASLRRNLSPEAFLLWQMLMMQCVVSMLGSTVLMAALAVVPRTCLPTTLRPMQRGITCFKWNAFSITVRYPTGGCASGVSAGLSVGDGMRILNCLLQAGH